MCSPALQVEQEHALGSWPFSRCANAAQQCPLNAHIRLCCQCLQVAGSAYINPAADSDKRASGKNGKRNCNRGKPMTRVRQLAAEGAVERLQLFQCDSSTLGQRNMAQQRCVPVPRSSRLIAIAVACYSSILPRKAQPWQAGGVQSAGCVHNFLLFASHALCAGFGRSAKAKELGPTEKPVLDAITDAAQAAGSANVVLVWVYSNLPAYSVE